MALRRRPSDFNIDLAIDVAARINGGKSPFKPGNPGSLRFHEKAARNPRQNPIDAVLPPFSSDVRNS